MGLDTSHDAWHGPYSRFGRFREWLASKIGFDLNKMEGFGGSVPFEKMKHDIKPLLDHSDCDGELTPAECRQVANGLKQIIEGLPAEEPKDEFSHYSSAVRFMEGCLRAARENKCLDFH